MAITTLTTKGQVTIPKEIRKQLKINTGDKIDISIVGEGQAMIRPVSQKVDDVFGIFYKPGRKPVSIEEMDEAIANGLKEKYK